MQSTTIIKYKPVRIGFLVREGHREDLVKVAGLNTLLWGGIFNPILPIGTSSADLPDQLLDLLQVEVLCSLADTPEIKAFRDKYPLLKNPAHPADDVLSQDWYAKRNVLAYLDSLNIIVLLWELEYKHKGEDFRSDFALFTWNPEGPLSDLFSISFGFYPTQYGLRDNYADAFLKGLRSRQMAIELGSPVPADLVISQLSATSMQLRITGERLRDDGIYVGNAENFSDLVTFWNLRAAGMMIRFLPVGHETRVSAAVTTFLQHLDKRP